MAPVAGPACLGWAEAGGLAPARSDRPSNGDAVVQRRANRRCAALSRSVQRPKGARLSAMLGLGGVKNTVSDEEQLNP